MEMRSLIANWMCAPRLTRVIRLVTPACSGIQSYPAAQRQKPKFLRSAQLGWRTQVLRK